MTYTVITHPCDSIAVCVCMCVCVCVCMCVCVCVCAVLLCALSMYVSVSNIEGICDDFLYVPESIALLRKYYYSSTAHFDLAVI